MKNDYLVRALAFDDTIRAVAVRATNLVNEAHKAHDTWNTATAALGRTLIAGLLLGSSQKGQEHMTIKVQGNGPIGSIIVAANAKGEVKGYAQNPHVSLEPNAQGKLDVRGAVGTEGTLTVIKDLGLKEPFTGQVPLVSGELGEDFTHYMAVSEQIPSAIGLSVLVDTDESVRAAGGFMVQVMPGASEETIRTIEERLANLPMVSSLIDEGKTPEELLTLLLGAENVHFLDQEAVSFHCDCSKEKFGQALQNIGGDALQEMITEDHGAETVCHFCNAKYQFSEEELKNLYDLYEKNKTAEKIEEAEDEA